jgi:hypothetical protein
VQLPSYVVTVYGMDLSTANYIIGSTTAVAGIAGNALSASILDYFVARRNKARGGPRVCARACL